MLHNREQRDDNKGSDEDWLEGVLIWSEEGSRIESKR